MPRASSLALVLTILVAICGCTSTQDVLDPSAIDADAPALAAEPVIVPGTTASSTVVAAAPAGQTRIQMAPIVGPTIEAAAPLTQRMVLRAHETGIGLTGSADPSANLVLKGYFAVVNEEDATILVYVWDIYDTGGNRLLRISGKQTDPTPGEGGWSNVSAGTMEAVADATMSELVIWLDARQG